MHSKHLPRRCFKFEPFCVRKCDIVHYECSDRTRTPSLLVCSAKMQQILFTLRSDEGRGIKLSSSTGVPLVLALCELCMRNLLFESEDETMTRRTEAPIGVSKTQDTCFGLLAHANRHCRIVVPSSRSIRRDHNGSTMSKCPRQIERASPTEDL